LKFVDETRKSEAIQYLKQLVDEVILSDQPTSAVTEANVGLPEKKAKYSELADSDDDNSEGPVHEVDKYLTAKLKLGKTSDIF